VTDDHQLLLLPRFLLSWLGLSSHLAAGNLFFAKDYSNCEVVFPIFSSIVKDLSRPFPKNCYQEESHHSWRHKTGLFMHLWHNYSSINPKFTPSTTQQAINKHRSATTQIKSNS
jgi:hypothetical protein